MKKIILFLLLLLLTFPLFAQFRGYEWGTSAEVIIASEGTPTEEEYSIQGKIRLLTYQDESALGTPCVIFYYFLEDYFVQGAYHWNTTLVEDRLINILFDQYPTTDEFYSVSKYPTEEIHEWKNLNLDDFTGFIDLHIYRVRGFMCIYYMCREWKLILEESKKMEF